MVLLSSVCTAEPQDIKALDIGQSYSASTFIESLATAGGRRYESKGSYPAGMPIRGHLVSAVKRGRAITFQPELESGLYNMLKLTPYLHNGDTGQETRDSVARFYEMALKGNPDMLVYVVTHWPPRLHSDRQGWMDENAPLFHRMVDEANASHVGPGRPLRLVPRGEAMLDLYRRARAGQVPGVTGLDQLYYDSGHAGAISVYLFNLMEYALIYGERPIGLPGKLETGRNGKSINLSDEQAELLQRLAWHHMITCARSGVSIEDDSTGPSAVHNVTAISPASDCVEVAWDPAEDLESDVFQYRIERNDGKRFETILPRLIDREVKENTSYTYRIAAENFAGGVGPQTDAVEIETPLDDQPPVVEGVLAASAPTVVQVEYSEAVDIASSCDPANYSIDGGITVSAVAVGPSPTIFLLTSSPLSADREYRLTVRNVRDTAGNPNVIEPSPVTFRHTPPLWTEFDTDAWDDTEVVLEKGTQVRIATKGTQPRFFWSGQLLQAAGLYRELAGDFDFRVTLTSQGKTQGCQTGIIFADRLPDGILSERSRQWRFGMLVLRGPGGFQGNKFAFTVSHLYAGRTKTIQNLFDKQAGQVDCPVWLRLKREGNTMTAFTSKTGAGPEDWQKLATEEIPTLGQTLQVGIFNCSGNAEEENVAMFDLRGTSDTVDFTESTETD